MGVRFADSAEGQGCISTFRDKGPSDSSSWRSGTPCQPFSTRPTRSPRAEPPVRGGAQSRGSASVPSANRPSLFGKSSGRSEDLRRDARSLFNKITPENETCILSRLRSLNLSCAEDLQMVAFLAVEKAINDPFYSAVYARAVRNLSLEYPVFPRDLDEDATDATPLSCNKSDDGSLWEVCVWGMVGQISFAEAVLECCQRAFDGLFGEGGRLSVAVIDGTASGAAEEADAAEDEEQNELQTSRRRARAHVRFIGHLYGEQVVGGDCLQGCLGRLLVGVRQAGFGDQPWPPVTWLECACDLLQAAGSALFSSPVGRVVLRGALHRLELCQQLPLDHADANDSKKLAYPPRMQYMIKDVIEASQERWPGNSLAKKQRQRPESMSVRR